MQYRMSASDQRLYSPDRDVAHIFKSVMAELAERLEDMTLPELETMLQGRLTMDDRGEAVRVLFEFLRDGIINDQPLPEMADELEKVGWFTRVKPEARVAAMAYLGTIFLGIAFQGIREATQNNVGPLSDAEQTVKAGLAMVDKAIARSKQSTRLSTVLKNLGVTPQQLKDAMAEMAEQEKPAP